MAVKEYPTNEKGVVRCETDKGKSYYRGRARINGKLYYTNANKKYTKVKDAKDAREKLIEDVKASIALGTPIKTKELKTTFLVKDVLKEYKEVLENLSPGIKYSRNTLNEKIRQLGQMIKDDYYCCIRDLPVKSLTNDKLSQLKNSFYMIRNAYGNRYKIDTIRSYLNTFKEAFFDSAMKNALVREKNSSLNWDNIKATKSEQNSPTQLAILDNEKNAINGKLKIGDSIIEIKGPNKKSFKKKRVNEATHWDFEDYRSFNKVYHSLYKEMKERIDNNEKIELKYTEYQQAVIYQIAYWTGMRLGEIRAMRFEKLYYIDNVMFYNLDHAIPQKYKIDYSELIENDKVWNNECVPKNRKERPVIIEEDLIEVLDFYKKVYNKSSEKNKYDFLFYNLSPSILDKDKEKFFKKYKLKMIRFHDFRHSTANREKNELNNSSADVAVILGHSDDGKLVDKYYAPREYKDSEKKLIDLEANKKLKRKNY